MGLSVDVNRTNFATEVVERSYEKPVLIDFFATWCGPCQILKPILEKLVREYDFVLAKVDIDQNPDLASAYGIEGVPDVRVVTQGQVLPGFVGVLPEPRLRELLTQLNLKSDLETGLADLETAIAAGKTQQAQGLLERLREKYPDNRSLLLKSAKLLIQQGEIEAAEQLLNTVQADEKAIYSQANALKTVIQFQRECQEPTVRSEWDEHFLKAARSAIEEDYEAALQGFLNLVGRDRTYRNDGARKAMIAIFDLLGDGHPLTKTYRKQLLLTLY